MSNDLSTSLTENSNNTYSNIDLKDGKTIREVISLVKQIDFKVFIQVKIMVFFMSFI